MHARGNNRAISYSQTSSFFHANSQAPSRFKDQCLLIYRVPKSCDGSKRKLGIRCVIYLGDLIIMGQDKERIRKQTWAAVDLIALCRLSGRMYLTLHKNWSP